MKPTHEQEIMLYSIKDSLALPAHYRAMATKLINAYDPVKHAGLDIWIRAWNEGKGETE